MDLDQSVIGLTGKEYVFEVEKRHIRQFSNAIGDSNKLYTDEEYASNSAYGGLIVPPTFPVVISAEGGDLPVKLDYRRMLHGEQEFIYYKPIHPGDRLHCQLRVTDLYEKEGKSGKMQFLVIDTDMLDSDGEMVVTSKMTIVYRGSSS